METEKQLLYLYRQQTESERLYAQTVEKNNRGFNGVDAGFCSSVAEWILSGKPMTLKQKAAVEKILPKYKHQLENGEWQNEFVPETAQPTMKEAKTDVLIDVLDIDPSDGTLIFIPATYPSKQIRLLSPFFWTGKMWKQPHPRVDTSLVNQICTMFPHTVVTDGVRSALVQKQTELSTEVLEHPTLFPFQKEAIQFMVEHKKVILALAPGLGKTACAIFAAKEAKAQRILVISPLSLMYTWKNEVLKWINEDVKIVYQQNCPVTLSHKWTVVNYDTIRMHLPSFLNKKWDCVIVDESILIKNRKAQRTQKIKHLVTSCKPEYVWLLSGAPTSRLYDDLWSQLNCLSPARFSSYWRFAKEYCYVEENQWGWQIVANRSDAAERLQKDLVDIFFARTQDQVLDLPDWIFEDYHVRMEEEQDKIYADMEEKFVAELEDGSKLLAPNVLSQLIRLIQLSSNPVLIGGKDESAKWNAVEEILEFEELPAIVWTSFIKTAELLKKRLEKQFRVEMLTGETSSQARQEIVDKFQRGDLDVLIAHPGVGKFGFTLTAARTAVYLERTYNGDDYYQSLHRIRRIGTAKSPHVIHLISDRMNGAATVDGVINRILKDRRDNVLKLTQGELKTMFEEVKNES